MDNNQAVIEENRSIGDVVLGKNVKDKWTTKKTNIQVVEEAAQTRSLVNRLSRQQVVLISHMMKRQGLEHLVITGKLEGKGGKERQR